MSAGPMRQRNGLRHGSRRSSETPCISVTVSTKSATAQAHTRTASCDPRSCRAADIRTVGVDGVVELIDFAGHHLNVSDATNPSSRPYLPDGFRGDHQQLPGHMQAVGRAVTVNA